MLDLPEARPYFIRAVYQWCEDKGGAPFVVARWEAARYPGVPARLAAGDKIVFNISSGAVRRLVIDDEAVRFTGRFLGKTVEIQIPLADILAIYSRETGKGLSFMPLKKAEKAEQAADAPAPAAAAGKKPNLQVI